MKTKQEYIDFAKKKWNEVLKNEIKEYEDEGFVKSTEEGLWIHPVTKKKVYPSDTATESYAECLNAEEIVGYYLWLHGEDALKDWLDNTNEIEINEQSKKVDRILKELCM